MMTVWPGKTLRELRDVGVGLNLNYLLDHDANRPPGSRPLAEALRELGVTHLRYPGGEKSDAFLWSVPPFDVARPTLSRTGPAEWPAGDRRLVDESGQFIHTPLDFDTFLALCREVSAEPVVVVALDAAFKPAVPPGTSPTYGELKAAAVAWVEYANVRRGAGVIWWELGNESYLSHYAGEATAEQYADAVVEFTEAMKAVDPTIRIGANGWDFPDKPGKVDESRGDLTPWWQTVMHRAGDSVDFFALHHYPGWGWQDYRDYAEKPQTREFTRTGLAGREIEQRFDPIPPAKHPVGRPVLITETNVINWEAELHGRGWAPANDLGHAVALAESLGHMLSAEQVQTAMVWGTRWLAKPDEPDDALARPFDVLDDHNQLRALGEAMAAHGRLPRGPGRRLVRIDGPEGLPAFAVVSRDGTTLGVLVVNKTLAPRAISLHLADANGGVAPLREFSGEALTGTGPADTTPSWQPLVPDAQTGTLRLPPCSVSVFRGSLVP
ncbi:MAG: alpha-L-arabinofuranosidase [Phycisphaerae bacterium]